jgi:hypothetical protein
VDIVANDEELVGCRVAVADGGVEDILCVLDQIRGYVEIVCLLLTSDHDHKSNVIGSIPVVSKSK